MNIKFLFLLSFVFINLYSNKVPKVSIITSVYKGDLFIKGFMENIVQQTIFDQCELIIINANSPGNEEAVISEYLKKYPEIVYVKLDKDPGLYNVWNLGIKMAKAEYITNANVDDRFEKNTYELFSNFLDKNPQIDLVYSDFIITDKPNETFEKFSVKKNIKIREFSLENLMGSCLPNNHPMWRKSMHDKYGFFDGKYKSSGDFEMWIRAALSGSVFKKIEGIHSLYYYNPNGISTVHNSPMAEETREIRLKYLPLYQKKNSLIKYFLIQLANKKKIFLTFSNLSGFSVSQFQMLFYDYCCFLLQNILLIKKFLFFSYFL